MIKKIWSFAAIKYYSNNLFISSSSFPLLVADILPKAYLAQRNLVLIQKGLSEPRPFIVLNLKFPFSFTKCYGSSVHLQRTLSSASVSPMNVCQLGFAGRLQEKPRCELSSSFNLITRNYLNRSIVLKMRMLV